MGIIVEGSINGLPAVQGGQELAATDTLQLSLRPNTMAGVAKVLWEIYEYPPAGTCPEGWESAAGAMRFWYSATAATDLRPPLIDFTGQAWGKWFIRATANDGLVGGVATPSMIDESFAVSIESPANLEDVGALEAEQFGPLGNIGALKRLIRDLNGITMPEPGADGEILTSDGSDWASEPFPFGSPVAVGSANADGSAVTAPRADHVHAHGNQGGGTLHALATHAVPGFMSAEDKEKLDGLEGGSSAGAWPSACALVFDFTKPATIAVHSTITTGDLASGFDCDPVETEPPNPYIAIGTPTGNEYPITAGGTGTTTRSVIFTEAVETEPGYVLFRVCAEAVNRQWIAVDASGADATVWFNVNTGAIGTERGTELVEATTEADGDSGWVCDVLVNCNGGALRSRIYVCDADGSLNSTEASVPAIILKQFDLVHGGAGQDIIQKRVERIESVGSRRTTCAWQDENEPSQPALFDGYSDALPGSGAFFGGLTNGMGINTKRLRILDPAGAYDLVRQFSAPAAPWTLYVVCSLPDDDTSDRVIFNLGASTTRSVSALFYDGNVVLRDTFGASIVEASIAQPVGAGMHFFAFYYGGGTLRVGADDLLGDISSNANICAEPFTVATLGGSGDVALDTLSECRALMQVAIVVPEKCDPFSTDDTAIRAKLATDFSVTTLLGT